MGTKTRQIMACTASVEEIDLRWEVCGFVLSPQ